jgi:flagellar biosynthesis chaperone FliJ
LRPPSGLMRLHSLRMVEEQQLHEQLNIALGELRRLHEAADENRQRMRRARALILSAVRSSTLVDRLAGLEEVALADRRTKAFVERIRTAEQRCIQAREQFLAKRVERRQVETLLDAERQRAVREENRRSQQQLDEWFRLRSAGDRRCK